MPSGTRAVLRGLPAAWSGKVLAGQQREGGGETAGHTLAVLRHAKAVHEPGLGDEERGLTKRGLRDASAAGARLREAGLIPDLVLCSTALRTRQTWEQVRTTLGPAGQRAEVSYEPGMYLADSGELLDIITQIPGKPGTVLLVGHNPAFHQLVADLTGRHEPAFPTSALAVIRLPGSWRHAAPGSGELVSLWTPHGQS